MPGYRVLIRHSKIDQEGQGQEGAIPRGYRLRPVDGFVGHSLRAGFLTSAAELSVAVLGMPWPCPAIEASGKKWRRLWHRQV
jgi:hypothetical protein